MSVNMVTGLLSFHCIANISPSLTHRIAPLSLFLPILCLSLWFQENLYCSLLQFHKMVSGQCIGLWPVLAMYRNYRNIGGIFGSLVDENVTLPHRNRNHIHYILLLNAVLYKHQSHRCSHLHFELKPTALCPMLLVCFWYTGVFLIGVWILPSFSQQQHARMVDIIVYMFPWSYLGSHSLF